MIETLLLASHNKGKLKEFDTLLQGLVGEVKSAADMRLIEPAETGTTFLENATIKALAAMRVTGLPSLSDDSGLSINALNGDPGVYSADWAGYPRDFQKAMALVHEKMGDASDKSAYFTSVLVLAYPDGRIEHFEGRVNGAICWPPRGVEGFGYDPMFVPEGYDKSFGELSADIKKSISHRVMAVEKFITYLKGEKA
ncbi:MAG: non-canonical purine NTP pyrophosphatase, RdgB/HAM1 family [Micavibrio aeruginosavorus]|uniref:dITP/XTP pyrophosphatase n=1 Tax=Micavibrio aeruginosavorus TaxID=349221 RepID=A0A2W5MUN5_9BACT|nr:MAG: non-canonical purine NTP pyrophosphatase, RdgB/HAM1 family [Micavibrio aeruginosavorus]